MFNFDELKYIQIEITNRCQASCPMCSRNVRGGLPNENLIETGWSLEDYKHIFDQEVLSQIHSLGFCGSYGEPIMNSNLIDMITYTRSINPILDINIDTNGSARTNEWWVKLAQALGPSNHLVRFGLDGLADTHPLYRIGTNYNQILNNAKAFIDAGGRAEWKFLIFRHNEHQVDQARDLATKLNFSSFQALESNRYVLNNSYDVYNKDGSVSHVLQPPISNKVKQIEISFIKDYESALASVPIDCESKREKTLYIDANCHLYPCCYLAGVVYTSNNFNEPLPTNDNEVKEHWRSGTVKLKQQITTAINNIGGYNAIDLRKRKIKSILEEKTFQSGWEDQHTGDKNIMCFIECNAADVGRTKFKDSQPELSSLHE